MLTHIWSSATEVYVTLQGAQSKRLNTILVNPKMVADTLRPFSLDNPKNTLDGDALKDIYKLGPMLFPTIERAQASCIKIVCDTARIQSLTKLVRVWPCIMSLGSGDSSAFYDLVKRHKFLDALKLLMCYVYVPGVSEPHQIGLPVTQSMQAVLEEKIHYAQFGDIKAYKQGFIDVLTGGTDATSTRI